MLTRRGDWSVIPGWRPNKLERWEINKQWVMREISRILDSNSLEFGAYKHMGAVASCGLEHSEGARSTAVLGTSKSWTMVVTWVGYSPTPTNFSVLHKTRKSILSTWRSMEPRERVGAGDFPRGPWVKLWGAPSWERVRTVDFWSS